MLTTKERSKLRSMATTIKASVHIGKNELNDNILKEIETALFHNELVKVNVLKSCTISSKELLAQTADALLAEPVCSIGNKFVLYKFTDKKDFEHIL